MERTFRLKLAGKSIIFTLRNSVVYLVAGFLAFGVFSAIYSLFSGSFVELSIHLSFALTIALTLSIWEGFSFYSNVLAYRRRVYDSVLSTAIREKALEEEFNQSLMDVGFFNPHQVIQEYWQFYKNQ